MKLVLIILVVLAVIYAQNDDFSQPIIFCSQKVGISPEEGLRLAYSIINDAKDKQKCFTKCLLEQKGYLDQNGNFLKDKISELLKHHLGISRNPKYVKLLNKNIDLCTALTGHGECGTALEVHNCYWKKIKGQ